jgi:prepilin-type N-terminal cleavage/methylation domain-containing protein
MRSKKGFTLIELLVVIAIIGILAAIVLVSLRGAPSRAKNARITADLTQVRSIAALIYADDGNYNSLCNATDNTLNEAYSGELATIESDITTQQGTGGTITCYAGTLATGEAAYCVSASLIGGEYFCVDSTGIADKYSANGCDSVNFTCAAD